MKNIKSLSEIDAYYKDWHKVINSKGVRYNCPPALGTGYVQLIGDVNTVFVSIVDYVEYHSSLVRSYMKEQTISIAQLQSASGEYYQNKLDKTYLETGIKCGINALPKVWYSKTVDNSYLKSSGLVIREAFLRTLSIEQHDLELMAYHLNKQPIYSSSLLLICKQLSHIPVADHLIPLYLKAKATEIISLLMNLMLKAKDKPKLTKENLYSIKLAKNFLDDHYISPPRIEVLAHMFYINKNLLQIGFKSLTGYTVYEYISYQRVGHAVELLLSTDMTIAAIADKVGYKSKMNFYNTFKKFFLTTPKELKKNSKRTC